MSTDILTLRKSYFDYYLDYCKAITNSCNNQVDENFDCPDKQLF